MWNAVKENIFPCQKACWSVLEQDTKDYTLSKFGAYESNFYL